jgi:hypothetical protein
MTHRPSAFCQRDVTRAIRAVVAAGRAVVRVEIDPDGKIIIVTTDEPEGRETNSWDRV